MAKATAKDRKPSPLKGKKLSQDVIDRMVAGRRKAREQKEAMEQVPTGGVDSTFIAGDDIPKLPRRVKGKAARRIEPANLMLPDERAAWAALVSILIRRQP